MYRFGSNIRWVYELVSTMKENSDRFLTIKSIPFEPEIFRMNLSKVARDNGSMFITRIIDNGEVLYLRRIK